MENILLKGDCIELMKDIPDKSIDMICTDLPYNLTKNKWDILIPFDLLWEQYERIIKDNGAIILFGQGIFSAKLILSNEKLYRYTIIWEKTTPTGFLNANRMPLRSHENIEIFYKNLPTYHPQKSKNHPRKISSSLHKRNSTKTTNYGEHGLTSYDSTERFPKSIWTFSTDKQKSKLSATQKPVKLIEELIKTYSNEGDLILDSTAGSGTTAIGCINTNRRYILMEKDDIEFEKMYNRIESYKKS